MATATVNARVDLKSKEQAKVIIDQLGLNMSKAIEMFLRQVVLNRGIPFDIKLPNQDTINARAELEAGGGKVFSAVEDLMEDLES